VGIRHADHATSLYTQKLALTSKTSGGRVDCIVRLYTKGHGVCFVITVSGRSESHLARLCVLFISKLPIAASPFSLFLFASRYVLFPFLLSAFQRIGVHFLALIRDSVLKPNIALTVKSSARLLDGDSDVCGPGGHCLFSELPSCPLLLTWPLLPDASHWYTASSPGPTSGTLPSSYVLVLFVSI
jgi:hypothetical protein